MEVIAFILVISIVVFAFGLYADSGSSEPLSYGSSKEISYESVSRKELHK